MKKSYLLVSFLNISILFCQAQMSSFRIDKKAVEFIDQSYIECIYKYTAISPKYSSESPQFTSEFLAHVELDSKVQSSENMFVEEFLTILQANASISKFWDYHSYLKDSILFSSDQQLSSDSIRQLEKKYKYWIQDQFIPVIFKNYPNGKITETNEIAPYDYIYKEPFAEINWSLKEDTIMIRGYLCQKAVGRYCGREWIVWYTPEIAISNGPWKLSGLPGLILKATDLSETHTFEAIAIRTSNHPIYIAKNSMLMQTSKKKFLENKAILENTERPADKVVFQMDVVTLVPGIGSNTIFVNGKRMKLFKTAIYAPLELE